MAWLANGWNALGDVCGVPYYADELTVGTVYILPTLVEVGYLPHEYIR